MQRSKTYPLLAGLGLTATLLPTLSWADWLAFEGDSKPWSFNVGSRVWMNEWESNSKINIIPDTKTIIGTPIKSSLRSSELSQRKSESVEATAIPFVSARYGRFFISGSHYATTEFGFNPSSVEFNSTIGTQNAANIKQSASSRGQRSEWDVGGGYYILPSFAITAGYKRLDMSIHSVAQTTVSVGANPATNKSTEWSDRSSFYGPTLGFAGSLPIDKNFGLYASYTHGFMTLDYQRKNYSLTARDEDVNYDVGELGVTYTPNVQEIIPVHLPMSSASIFAGYRYQRLNYSVDIKDHSAAPQPTIPVKNATDTTQGFVAGVNIGF